MPTEKPSAMSDERLAEIKRELAAHWRPDGIHMELLREVERLRGSKEMEAQRKRGDK